MAERLADLLRGVPESELIKLSTEELDKVIARLEAESGQPSAPALATTSPFTAITESLKSGVGQVLSGTGGTLEMLGFEQAGKSLQETGQKLSVPQPKVETSFRSAEGAVDWLVRTISQQVPVMGTTAGGATAGAAAGSVFGPKGAVVGGLVGAYSMSLLQNMGDTYLDLKERGFEESEARSRAGFVGPLQAVLDVVTPVRLLNKLRWLPLTKGAVVKGVGREAVGTAVSEFATEVPQEGLGILAAGEKIDKPEAVSRLLNAGAASLAVGAAFGGGTAAVSSARTPRAMPAQIDLSEPGAPEPAGDAPTPPVAPTAPIPESPLPESVKSEPNRFVLDESSHEAMQEYGKVVEAKVAEAPRVLPDVPLYDPKSALSDDERTAVATSPVTADVMKVARSAVKRAATALQNVPDLPGVEGLKGMDLVALVDAPASEVIEKTPGKYTLALNPLPAASVHLSSPQSFAEATWDGMVGGLAWVASQGVQPEYARVYPLIEGALAQMKQGVLQSLAKAYGGQSLRPEVAEIAPAFERVVEQDLLGGSTLDAFFYRITFSGSRLANVQNRIVSKAVQDSYELFKLAAPLDLPSGRKSVVFPGSVPLYEEDLPSLAAYTDIVEPVLFDIAQLAAASPEVQALNLNLANLPAAIEGLGIQVTVDSLGQFMPVSADFAKWRVAINPVTHINEATANALQEGRTEYAAVETFSTLVHELTHAAVFGHGRQFLQTEAALHRAVAPFASTFIDRIEAAYGNRHTGFNPELTKLFEAAYARAHELDYSSVEELVAEGQATLPAGKSRVVVGRATRQRGGGGRGIQAAAAGAFATGERGGGGTRSGEPETAFESTDHGQWPESSPQYERLIEKMNEQAPRLAAEEPDTDEDLALADVTDTSGVIAGLARKVRSRNRRDVVKFNKFMRKALTLLQWGQQNQNVVPLQNYLKAAQGYWRTKTRIALDGDKTLRMWNKLGKAGANRVGELHLQRMDESINTLKRKHTLQEVQAMAQKLGLNQRDMDMFWEIDRSLIGVLGQLEAELKAEVTRLFPDPLARQFALDQVQKEMDFLRQRDFFPAVRFGDFVVHVRSEAKSVVVDGKTYKKGQTIEFPAFPTEREAKAYAEELRQRFHGQQISVKTDVLPDVARGVVGFPVTLFDTLATKLNLNPAQLKEMRQVMFKFTPGKGFVKHLKRKRGIAGFSRDAQRAYADYMMHASNHIARLKHRWDLESAKGALNQLASAQAEQAVPHRQLYAAVEQHYQDLMNPGNDLSWMRGLLFVWYFGLVPKQVVVNLTQIPIFAYSYLAKKHGGIPVVADAAVARLLGGAIIDAVRAFRNPSVLSAVEQRLIARGLEAGFIDESAASELAGIAESNVMERYLSHVGLDGTYRKAINASTWMFRQSEELNRRITFLASVRMALEKGMSEDGAFAFGKEAVDTTMFEYGRFNRPEIMRGKKGVLFVFRTYLQHALYFAASGQGGVRFALMMLLFGGVAGLPLADDLLKLLSAALTGVRGRFGIKNPKVDLEEELREFSEDLGMNPDLMMNGIARYSFGLTFLSHLAGAPFPAMDLSSSLQLGRVLPGAEAIARGAMGVEDSKEVVLRLMTEIAGPAAVTGTNMGRAVFENSQDSTRKLKVLFPAVVKNMVRTYEYMMRGAYVNARGNKLVDIDYTKPHHAAEILGQLMGATPTRVTTRFDRDAAFNESRKYYLVRRDLIIGAYALAVGSQDREAIADAKAAMRRFSNEAPAPYRINARELRESIRDRVKNARIREMGLPEQKRYYQLFKATERAYPSPL